MTEFDEYYSPQAGSYYVRPVSLDTAMQGSLVFKPAAPVSDNVRPAHYDVGSPFEPAKFIAHHGMSYNCGSALAYLARLGKKAPDAGQTRMGKDIEDIRKAIRHLEMEITALVGHGSHGPSHGHGHHNPGYDPLGGRDPADCASLPGGGRR